MDPTSGQLALGATAPDFSLPGIDGRTWTLADVAGPNGTVVMFICNHCPYVKAVVDRIVRDMAALRELGIGAVAISSNASVNSHRTSFRTVLDVRPGKTNRDCSRWAKASNI